MFEKIKAGITGEARAVVSEANTAIAFGSGSVNVFGTPAMIGLMENAALSSVDPLLEEGYTTVGTKVDVQHLAATPIGMEVVARSKLVEVDGRRLVFEVEASDGAGPVGRGIHERYIVKLEGFLKKAGERANQPLRA